MTPDQVFAQFCENLAGLTSDDMPPRIGVAVSGGGDSMALLDLAQRWAVRVGWQVHAITVDHGLRDSADEIGLIAAFCKKNAISHHVSIWTDWDKVGNLQSAARAARHAFIEDWAETHEIDVVLLGHTAEDQAETVLMRLARGSGVDGLAGMPAQRGHILRPLLDLRRADLRAYLRSRDLPWAEDPSNDDTRFDRVKARQMMGQLEALGLTTERLLQTAQHMQKAQSSLDEQAVAFARTHVHAQAGDLIVAAPVLQLGRSDTPARVLSQAIRWIGGTPFRPRYDALREAAEAVQSGETRTLGGVLMVPQSGGARLSRELNAIRDIVICDGSETMRFWDRRWRIAADATVARPVLFEKGMIIKVLGDDITLIKDWRDAGLPRATVMTSPSLWRGAELIAAPIAGFANGWTAQIVADFPSSLLMH